MQAMEAGVAELTTTHGRVARARRLTSRLVEVTLTGFHASPLVGGDEFVYVMMSPATGGIPADYGMDDFRRGDPDDPVRGAYYTVRRARPDVGEIDLWVVDHGHPGGVGSWLCRAQPGEPLALWGPRRGFAVHGVEHVLLVADETGFAAVAAILDRLPITCRATAVLESLDGAARPAIPFHPGLRIVWVDRGSEAPGVTNRLLAAVALLDVRPDAAFGAGESHHIAAIRRHVRRVLGIPAARVLMTGYWRREDLA